ncbi:YdcF family protein [Thermoactinomyces sp. AMNI-1]|uniref:YdcF family protein n=2 Tax=Thermoactinomyces mirandus TaxID=2756294 RepID=A0A7W2ATA8_9BACL|nr:YdcF family protein [Thermoactinomyces mirandus]
MIVLRASIIVLSLLIAWFVFYMRGKQFALRNRLQKADAIVVLAGTRENIKFLDGKISTSVQLYRQGWASRIICSGRFSAKVDRTGEPNLIPLKELQSAARNGRIQKKDIEKAAKTWDTNLGAGYMRKRALAMGVPPEAILVEDESLHTRENAELYLLCS